MGGGETMKVIIAYDGSTYADAAIDDLPRAGIPPRSEIQVVWVADLSTNAPSVSEFDLLSAASGRMDAALARMTNFEAQVVKETRNMTENVVRRLRQRFPEWNVHSKVLRGKPADELLRRVDEWNADLIMGGSQGRGAVGRFFLGSVSKRASEEASCSVRVVRGGSGRTEPEPIEIIIGATNPDDAAKVIDAVGKRAWAAGTRILLLAVDDGVTANRVSAVYPNASSIYEQAVEGLADLGLEVSVQIERGDPKSILLKAVDDRRPDAIFVAAGKADDQSGLDETASALVTGAKCAVEIVR
jgi:nucleotide-binding universal stress UspA family protein